MPLTPRNSLLVADLEMRKAEAARLGFKFGFANGNGSTFLASVTAVPTSTATMALFNLGTKNIYIDRLSATQISGTSVLGGVLLATVTTVAQARPTLSTGSNGGYAGTVISGLAGQLPTASGGVFLNAITLTGTQSVWVPVATSTSANGSTTIATESMFSDAIDGSFMIPPNYCLGLAIIAAAGTNPLWMFAGIYDEY